MLLRDLQRLPRIGTSTIDSPEKMRVVLESLAFNLADLRERLIQERHPDWWHLADALDDVMDIYEAQFGPVPPCESDVTASECRA